MSIQVDPRVPRFLTVSCLLLCGCGEHAEVPREELQALPRVAPSPADNPLTTEKVELGRLLFWDPILSGHQDVACGTCHHPDFGYGDGLDLSIGVGGSGLGPSRIPGREMPIVPRNAPTVLNTGFNGWVDADAPPDPALAPMFWDNREVSLEAQALGPIRSDVEMRGDAYSEDEAVSRVVERLAEVPEYVVLFAEAFEQDPSEAVSEENLARAIAAFERHLSQPNSAYDRWLAGDDSALSGRQRRGLNAFHGLGCADCHLGPMFSDYEMHRIGVPEQPGTNDEGDGTGRFRTPTLRNIALTAPYMHSGRIGGMNRAIEFYDEPEGRDLDPLVRGLDVERRDEKDLESFLRALTDDFDREIPTRVPSGLPPGGEIAG
ncbi:MAG: cytochrome-c peroxidase [Nannocystales bacterium]